MRTKAFFIISFILFSFTGCNVSKQLGGAYNMTQCKYDYNSISNLTLSGINLSNGPSVVAIAQLTSILTGNRSSIPMNFTINLDVSNPNQTPALLHGLQYVLKIDNIEFTNGSVNQPLNIPSGGTSLLPLTIGMDIATLLRGDSGQTVENIVKNFIGIGNEKSKVTLQLKPTFMIGNQAISSPYFIPVNFSFGGK